MALVVDAVGCHPSQSLVGGSPALCDRTGKSNPSTVVFCSRASEVAWLTCLLHLQVARWAIITTCDALTELLLVVQSRIGNLQSLGGRSG